MDVVVAHSPPELFGLLGGGIFVLAVSLLVIIQRRLDVLGVDDAQIPPPVTPRLRKHHRQLIVASLRRAKRSEARRILNEG